MTRYFEGVGVSRWQMLDMEEMREMSAMYTASNHS